MRTLIAAAMASSKDKNIYCAAKKVSEQQIKIIRDTEQEELENVGFTFIDLVSRDYPNVRGKAIFFEGHITEMSRALKNIEKGLY